MPTLVTLSIKEKEKTSAVVILQKQCRAVALNGNMKSEEEGKNSRLAASNNVA